MFRKSQLILNIARQLTALLGSIGGIFGVYLGFSFLAIYEMAEVLIRGTLCYSSSSEDDNEAEVEEIDIKKKKNAKIFATKTSAKKAFN